MHYCLVWVLDLNLVCMDDFLELELYYCMVLVLELNLVLKCFLELEL